MRRRLALLFLALALPAAAESEIQWMKVLLDGRKVGHVRTGRAVEGDTVTTTEFMRLAFDRSGVAMRIESEDRSIESTDGTPRGFASRIDLAGSVVELQGHRAADGSWEVVQRNDGSETRQPMAWPEGALLAEGVRLLLERKGLATGTRYGYVLFQAAGLGAVDVTVHVLGPDPAAADPDGPDAGLVRVDQRVALPGAPITMRSWVTPDFDMMRSTLPVLGVELEMIACDETCATAPDQSADVLAQTLVASPRALGAGERGAGLRYRLALEGAEPPALPRTSEQQVDGAGARVLIEVDPTPDVPDTRPPSPSDRGPNRWLESDEAAVLALAREAAGDASDARTRMQRLEAAVRAHITDKGLQVGYASAAQTLASRAGDCTEHAVLLAALGRALDIPTRVVSGIAYAPGFGGQRDVFVPHAWTEAWIDDRWMSFDAALPGFDAGHIAFGSGDGDPAGFYAGVSLLGNVRIEAVEALPAGGER
jgi:hypothetical protein